MLLEKFQGCLVGGAIGDALGYKVEFMDINEIHNRFGSCGIRDLVVDAVSNKALISDDTQMTLFTAEGLLWAHHGGRHKDISSYASCVFYAYQRWLYTQTRSLASQDYKWILNNEELDYKSDLLSVRELYARRAPGNTCLNALISSSKQNYGTISCPINNSKGCGGVMRVAPVGMYFYDSPQRAFRIAAECAALTHGHPSGYLSAGTLGAIVAEILSGKDILQATNAAVQILQQYEGHEECLHIIDKALELLNSESSPVQAISQLGQGWVGEEALAMAIYCTLKYPNNFEEAICLAVNHSGDSDSIGAICGNILGAYLGINAISDNWIQNVEMADVIMSMSNKLFRKYEKLSYYAEDLLLELYKYDIQLEGVTFGLFIHSNNNHKLIIKTRDRMEECIYSNPIERVSDVVFELGKEGLIKYSVNMHFMINLTEDGRKYAREIKARGYCDSQSTNWAPTVDKDFRWRSKGMNSIKEISNEDLNIRKSIVNLFNSGQYQELKNYYSQRSFFDILKIMRNENIHSNFIAWLLDPCQSHGLNVYPIKKFLEMLIIVTFDCLYSKRAQVLFPDDLIDPIITCNYEILDVDVEREKAINNARRIDIFISVRLKVGEEEKNLKIVLENKVYSKEHTDQTNAYFEWAQKEFRGTSEVVYVFLTPVTTNELLALNEQQCACKMYIQINYQYLVNYLLEPCKKQDMPEEANILIENYLRCLSYPAINEQDESIGGTIMATSERERKLLLNFWETNKPLLLAMLNVLKDDENIESEERDNMQKMISTISNKSSRDYTKYKLSGISYRKNRLVYAVISDYINKNPEVTFNYLKALFKDELQGSKGVVQTIEVVNKGDTSRFFSKPEEILESGDGVKFAVCNQWGIDNIGNFINVANALGYMITEV